MWMLKCVYDGVLMRLPSHAPPLHELPSSTAPDVPQLPPKILGIDITAANRVFGWMYHEAHTFACKQTADWLWWFNTSRIIRSKSRSRFMRWVRLFVARLVFSRLKLMW